MDLSMPYKQALEHLRPTSGHVTLDPVQAYEATWHKIPTDYLHTFSYLIRTGKLSHKDICMGGGGISSMIFNLNTR